MGYTTDFEGSFNIEPSLTREHSDYINRFSQTRRMKRNIDLTEKMPDPIREAVGLPLGLDAGYFVGAEGHAGQDHTDDILNFNNEPQGQPGLWCQWVPSDCGEFIKWNGCEKFYNYTEWLQYITQHFFAPWGYKINGEIGWIGEDPYDSGVIYAKDNMIQEVKDPCLMCGKSHT